MNLSTLGSLEHIAATPPAPSLTRAEYLRKTEQTLAYERASGVIEGHCITQEESSLETWWDLDTSEEDLADEVAYLDARRLLIYHPEHPRWVQLCDESEPLPAECHSVTPPTLPARLLGLLPIGLTALYPSLASDLQQVSFKPSAAISPQQNCAQDMVKAKHPETRVVRGVHGLVVIDEATGKTLGEGRMNAYWHEEAWMNAVEEVEGR